MENEHDPGTVLLDADMEADLRRVDVGVKKRKALESTDSSKSEKVAAERAICIATRSLFALYKDTVCWSGKVDTDMKDAVRQAIKMAVESVTVDRLSQESVEKRLAELEGIAPRIP